MSVSNTRRTILAALMVCTVPVCRGAGVPPTQPRVFSAELAVGPQYDSTHVYVAPGDLASFTGSFVATFGGRASNPIATTVTPTPSSTQFQFVMSPVGALSVFAYTSPVPYPFGLERTGYLVTDMDQALAAARSAGASIIVAPFKDPIGIDAIIEWPGGIKMQLYWHFTAPSYDALATVPENRIYVAPDRIDNFVNAFQHFSRGKVISDDWHADGSELGRPGLTFRRIRFESKFGKMQIMATDGQLPYPFGHEVSGYEVSDLGDTLQRASQRGAKILVPPINSNERNSAVVEFPGGFIAEIHSRIR
jgi:predicted enzyme related to lactoylglutathione lyase